jgi:cell division protein FtsZ
MNGDLKLSEAFSKADNVLTTAAKGIAEIITVHGYINVDFADVQTVMNNSGVAIMGSAVAEGENRSLEAIQRALNSPLLNNNDIRGAKNILLNITSGINEISMDEVSIITDFVTNAVAKDVLLIWGTGNDENLGDKICVTIIATGFEPNSIPELYQRKKVVVDKVTLTDENQHSHSNPNIFEVKTKENILTIDNKLSQRIIEFDLAQSKGDASADEIKTKTNKLKSSEHHNEPKKVQAKTKEIPASGLNDSNIIEDLENQPAYIRKNIDFRDTKTPTGSEISKFTLMDDEEKKIVLKPENPYLNDNVD